MATKQIPARTEVTCDACGAPLPDPAKVPRVRLEHPKGKRVFELCADHFDKVSDLLRAMIPEVVE